MRVLICVPTAEMGKQAIFYDYYNLIDKPVGTVATFCHGQSPARNRNLAIQQAIDNNVTHILFLDDDTCPPKDIITKLARHDKDAVCGLYLMRNFPHNPIIFDFADENGRCKHHHLNDGMDENELIELVATGLGCVLIKIEVFKAMATPWIRLGELESDHWCDDIGFFRRFREAGFKLYLDPSVRSGHMATATIWPNYKDGKWVVSYDTSGTSQVSFDMPRIVGKPA